MIDGFACAHAQVFHVTALGQVCGLPGTHNFGVGSTLDIIGAKKRRAGQPLEHVSQLPSQVVPVLHRGVATLPTRGRHDVGGIAGKEDARRAKPIGDAVRVVVGGVSGDLEGEIRHAHEKADQCLCGILGALRIGREIRYPLVAIVCADENARAIGQLRVLHVVDGHRVVAGPTGKIRVETDRGDRFQMPQAMRANAHLRGDAAPDTVGGHHILCMDQALPARRQVVQKHLHMSGLFGQAFTRNVEPHIHAQRQRTLEQRLLGAGLAGHARKFRRELREIWAVRDMVKDYLAGHALGHLRCDTWHARRPGRTDCIGDRGNAHRFHRDGVLAARLRQNRCRRIALDQQRPHAVEGQKNRRG